MSPSAFAELKKALYYANKRGDAAKWAQLQEQMHRECSPSQKAAVTRMIRYYDAHMAEIDARGEATPGTFLGGS